MMPTATGLIKYDPEQKRINRKKKGKIRTKSTVRFAVYGLRFIGSLTVEVAVRKSPQLRHPEADAVPEGVEHEEVDRGAHREQQPQEAPHRDERSETFQVAQDWKNTRKH